MGKFSDEINKGITKKNIEAWPEEKKKEFRLKKSEDVIEQIGNKENRYLFYCPDVPFPVGTVKTIYEHVLKLKKLGYTAEVIHEVEGFKPLWLDTVNFNEKEEDKKIKIHYLSKRDKKQNFSQPEFPFKPGDTIIVPDGFYKIMEAFYQVKQVQKVVFVMGYGGLATAEVNWGYLGFNNAICVSESLKEDYQRIWPNINFHVAGYSIDTDIFKEVAPTKKRPLISLAYRDRESAARFLSIFHNQYHYLGMFSFEILKKKAVRDYAKTLSESILLVLSDTKSGHPQWPLEALACNTPTLLVRGRGYEHLVNHPDIFMTEEDDEFRMADMVAQFCLNWLDENHIDYKANKEILSSYSEDSLTQNILSTYNSLQQELVERFVALKNTILKEETETIEK